MKKLLLALLVAFSIAAISPASALADDLMHGTYSQYDLRSDNLIVRIYGAFPKKLTVEVDTGPAQNYGLTGEMADSLSVTLSISRDGKSYKKVASKQPLDTQWYATIKNLRPNTMYYVKADFYTKANSCHGAKVAKMWTTPKRIKKKAVKSLGSNRYKWKKVKGAKGYAVRYKYEKYAGENKYGTRTYKVISTAKIVKKNRVKLKSGQKLIAVHPFARHGGNYYVDNDSYDGCVSDFKTKSQMLYMLRDETKTIYR